MKTVLYETLRLIRPRQWIKNLAVFAAIVFTGQLFDPETFINVLLSFFVFCLLSSTIYIVNDLFDIEKDKLHPFKKFRPLAKGTVPKNFAIFVAVLFCAISLIVGYFITPAFFLLLIIYALLQISYSAVLKNIAIIDIMGIAAGYILRVYGGEFASGYHISVWLLLTTITFSLFIAIGKRRSELTLVSSYPGAHVSAIRKSLSHYSEKLLDIYASMFATGAFLTYALFTFLENPVGFKISFSVIMPEFLPEFFQRKWLMITILPVVYCIMRYLQDIYEKHEGESPEKVLLSDTPLLTAAIVWGIMVVALIYVFGA